MSYSVEQLGRLSESYRRAIQDGIVGFAPFTQMKPWYFLPDAEIFDATEQWPSTRPELPLIAFARRQDCDDIACFELEDGRVKQVMLIEGWSAGGYSVIETHGNFEDWLKSASEDAAQVEAASHQQR